MAIDARIELALRAAAPFDALYEFAAGLLRSGEPRDSVVALFESAFDHLREADRESDEDAVADVIDCFNGWCGPHKVL